MNGSIDDFDSLETTFNFATAFNSGVPRFGRFTGHPGLIQDSSFNQPKGCDPCLYSPTDNYRKCITYVNGREPWTYQKNLEDWSKHLGYRNQSLLKERESRKLMLGPAWHDIPKEYPKYTSTCEDIGFGRTPRFKPFDKFGYPGPGTYYKKDPYKAPHGPHSQRPSFEREHPCRFRDVFPPWYRGMSSYNIKDNEDIAMKPKKIVSKRGPYDLFSVKREPSTIISKTTSKKQLPVSWPCSLPSCFDTNKKSHFGEFNKSNRDRPYYGRNALVDIVMSRKYPDQPGPGHYDPYPEKKVEQSEIAFNSSYYFPRNHDSSKLRLPCVGRYNIRGPPPASSGHRHVFESKVERKIEDIYKIQPPLNSF